MKVERILIPPPLYRKPRAPEGSQDNTGETEDAVFFDSERDSSREEQKQPEDAEKDEQPVRAELSSEIESIASIEPENLVDQREVLKGLVEGQPEEERKAPLNIVA